jgi:hypothetical protein
MPTAFQPRCENAASINPEPHPISSTDPPFGFQAAQRDTLIL